MKSPSPKFPVIDTHMHIRPDGVGVALDAMDSVGLVGAVNLSGGTVLDYAEGLSTFRKEHSDRFAICVRLEYEGLDDPSWAETQADALEEAVKAGVSGLKEVKRLGLGVRWKNGELLKIDDPVLDPVWDRCGKLGIPVIIHTTDPLAFHRPLSLCNERITELQAHPRWVFSKPGLPSKMEILEGRSRVMGRHPETKFVCVHFANFPEDPVTVTLWLEKHSNMYLDLSARFVEIGRHHPEMMHNFFVRYQGRILFGTDTGVSAEHMMLGVSMPSDAEFSRREDYKEAFLFPYYDSMYRYLETDDYHIPPSSPIQGRWSLHGIALPDEVLRKVYSENAKRVIPGLA
ncbi:MAG: amidohydrolase family protein [Planctomycetota bacterium]|jgi:predicted TIM-barrel fold metal-dependent hydrolase